MSKRQVSFKNVFFGDTNAGSIMFAFVFSVLSLLMGKDNYVHFSTITNFDTRKQWYMEAMFDYGLPVAILLCIVFWFVRYQQLKSKKLIISSY